MEKRNTKFWKHLIIVGNQIRFHNRLLKHQSNTAMLMHPLNKLLFLWSLVFLQN